MTAVTSWRLKVWGIALCDLRRDCDGAIWPFVTTGYFKVRKKDPEILETMSLT